MKVTIEDQTMTPDDRQKFVDIVERMAKTFGAESIEVVYKGEKRRTYNQNRAMWLWLTQVALGLNAAGLEQRAVMSKMREGFDVPWTKDTAKENLYKPIMEAMTGKRSSTELDTVEPSLVCDTLGRWLSENFGYEPPPWPSVETMRRV